MDRELIEEMEEVLQQIWEEASEETKLAILSWMVFEEGQ